MPLTTQTFAQLQAAMATQFSSQATLPANTNAGSTLGAIFNAAALLLLQVQSEAVYVDAVARLATSSGADADSFVLPFGVTRLGAVASSGKVTASTPSPVTQQLVVPVGGIFTTTTGLQFAVIADATASGYSASLNGYVIPIGQSSVSITVQCQTAGSIGNVAAGTITQIFNGAGVPVISGVTTVSNPSAFTNGADKETDAQLRTRFASLMSTGVVATANALNAAILGVQPGLTFSNGDGLNATGGPSTGTVTMIVGLLGTGTAPSGSVITACQAAVNAVRSAGVTVNVVAATLVSVNLSATIHCPVGTDTTALTTALTTAYQAFVNNLGLSPTGGTTECDLFTVGSILRAVANVTKVDSVTLNGGTADVVATFGQQLVAGTVTLSFVAP